jgi:hypothetical protein
MKTFTFLNLHIAQVTDLEQFRFQNGPKKGARREGMKYYIRYSEDGQHYFLQEEVSNGTSSSWLTGAISQGCIYLHKQDYEYTLSSLQSNQSEKSVKQ